MCSKPICLVLLLLLALLESCAGNAQTDAMQLFPGSQHSPHSLGPTTRRGLRHNTGTLVESEDRAAEDSEVKTHLCVLCGL